jgi:Na+:H+ antiporter, NhaC family
VLLGRWLHFGLISRLVNPLVRAAKSTGRLFVTVFATCFGLNVVAGAQYIALVLPARVFRPEFARRGLAPTNLSRLCADSATVTSPLIPWNSCGAFMGAVLGVSAFPVPAVCGLLLRQPGAERAVRHHRLQDRENRAARTWAGRY